MYNEELKTDFVKQYTTSLKVAKSCENLFNRTEYYEKELGKDICAMSVEEAEKIFDVIIGVREKSRATKFSILKEYSKWCLKNNVEGATDSFKRVNVLGLDSMRTTMVTSPWHLQKCLDDLFDPEDLGTIDCIYRCYYWITFGGFATDDRIMKIKCSDIHLDTMSFTVDGRDYPIYREGVRAFRDAVTKKQFNYYNQNRPIATIKDRADGDLLLRGYAQPSLLTFRVELSRKNKALMESGRSTTQINRYKIWLSGIFSRAYEVERAGLPVSFREPAEIFALSREYKNCTDELIRYKIHGFDRDFMNDYIRWKYAFDMM